MTITTQKNITRAKAVAEMVEIFKSHYGEENVYIIGDSEIAVKIDETEIGEPIFATFSPTVKDFQNRKTPKKTIPKFDPVALAEEWNKKLVNRSNETTKIKRFIKRRVGRLYTIISYSSFVITTAGYLITFSELLQSVRLS